MISTETAAISANGSDGVGPTASQTAKAACRLRASERWALTGTPIENHLGELWSVVRFLLPGFLGTEEEFRREYRDQVEAFRERYRRECFQARIDYVALDTSMQFDKALTEYLVSRTARG